MSKALSVPWVSWALSAVQGGLLVLDESLVVRFANPWMLKHTHLKSAHVLGQTLCELFPELSGSEFERRLRQAMRTGFPALLSETLHASTFPLYPQAGPRNESTRLRQSIQIIPTGAAATKEVGERYALVQVSDVTPAVARERLLKQQAERMRAMAHIDALTDIGNRRHFDDMFAREWRHALRAKEPLGLVLLDVDHFKQYNDRYGHQQGDYCLKTVASVIEALAHRPRDVVCRFGGEEIAMLLPNTELQGTLSLAHAAVQAVRARGLPHEASTTSGVLTISAGVAVLRPEVGMGSDTLLLLADRALYQAKRQGRDRVAVLDGVA